MWRFDEEAIKAATREEVIEGVNQLERRQESPKLQLNSTSGNIVLIKLILSPWFGFSRNFSSMLGGLTRNSSGHIIAATSALMVWVLEVSSLNSGQIFQVSNPPVSGGPLLPEQETCSAHHRAGPCRPRQPCLGRQPCGHGPQPLHLGDKVNLHLETLHLDHVNHSTGLWLLRASLKLKLKQPFLEILKIN